MQVSLLPDRGVIKVAGEGARVFLNGLLTCDVTKVAPGTPRFGALLTPQGKIIADAIVAEAPAADGGGFFLDVPRALAKTLTDKLNFYKLRAKVICEDLSEILGVMAAWDGTATTEYGLCYPDPRLPELGLRIMLPPHLAASAAADLGATLVDADRYEAHRIALGVPRGGLDFSYGDAFPHRPIWTSSAGSISPRAAISDRRWSPAWSIAAPRAPALCQCSTTGSRRKPACRSWQGRRKSGP